MNILTQYGKEIFSFIVPVFTLILNKYFKNNAKISYSELHQFTYLINEPLLNQEGEVVKPTQTVHTQSYVFRNEGKDAATNMEVIFNYQPMYLNVWPSRLFTVKNDSERRHVMVFDYLAPKETIRCEVLAINSQVPMLLSVRCKEGIARSIMLSPQRVFHPALINSLRFLIFLGSVSLVYVLVVLLQWLLLKTG
ncbi:hypothetical protein [Scandinavium goeteborgense]|uniref:Uncharacterized protein n=1 Tax=Scandinavium goeteborgense TaxID=1851514 RepID=A0A4R6DTL0_SCAGO|nr:hypothetical protein [Scandinavium goeteborgense]TDN47618.1 hypothetical protein EC847_13128 [Scandinavium goeteborgense]